MLTRILVCFIALVAFANGQSWNQVDMSLYSDVACTTILSPFSGAFSLTTDGTCKGSPDPLTGAGYPSYNAVCSTQNVTNILQTSLNVSSFSVSDCPSLITPIPNGNYSGTSASISVNGNQNQCVPYGYTNYVVRNGQVTSSPGTTAYIKFTCLNGASMISNGNVGFILVLLAVIVQLMN